MQQQKEQLLFFPEAKVIKSDVERVKGLILIAYENRHKQRKI